MRSYRFWIFGVVLLLVFTHPAAADPVEKVRTSADVLEGIVGIPEKSIPPQLLQNAHAIAIVPDVIKAGFIIGGRHGRGILLTRDEDGGWTNPLFISLTGGSIGWQIGAQSTDLILVFRTARSVDGILRGTFTLGADAAIAAGPVGRQVAGATDAELKAEILSYSRSRGLFAGISLEGASLQVDRPSLERFYGRDISARDILEGQGEETEDIRRVKALLKKHAGKTEE